MKALPQSSLHAELRAMGAEFQRDRSSSKRHIYWSGSRKKWIMVKRHPQNANYVVLSEHKACPCAYADD